MSPMQLGLDDVDAAVRAIAARWRGERGARQARRHIEAGDPRVALHDALRAKEWVAELAEEILLRLTRVLGGGTFSRRSPFAH